MGLGGLRTWTSVEEVEKELETVQRITDFDNRLRSGPIWLSTIKIDDQDRVMALWDG